MAAAPAARHDAVLMVGPWPHRRFSIWTIVHDLITELHRLGRSVFLLCDAFGLRQCLGPEAICLVEIPADQPFDWRAAFCDKRVYRNLTALLAADQRETPGRLASVGILHSHFDQLIGDSEHPANSIHYDQTLADYIQARSGRRPRLIRTRHDDLEGNLDRLMRLTGIDYVALGRPEREALLGGDVDLRPVVAGHVERHRELLLSWGCTPDSLDHAIHDVWWCLKQLRRWMDECASFDAVVCYTPTEVAKTRDWLLCATAANLTYGYSGTSLEPKDPVRVARLLHAYHHDRRLWCYRADGPEQEPIPFAGEDKKVLFVGRATRTKGIYELVESLRNLYHSGRRHVRGILVGDFGPELRRELAAVDPAYSRDYLLFTGAVEDVDVLASLYAFGDVTAIASHYEPFCLVGMESYRMGTPCVVTEGTIAGEVYVTNPRRHGVEMALPVRRRHPDGIARFFGVDVASLTEQLARLIDQPQTAGRLAADGERFVREQYSTERLAARYNRLYDLLLAGKPACRLHD